MNNDQKAAQRIHAQGYKSSLADSIGIFNRDRHRIVQSLLRMSKADAVFAIVTARLCGIEFYRSVEFIHIEYALSIGSVRGGNTLRAAVDDTMW